jgi:hypothetical protein
MTANLQYEFLAQKLPLNSFENSQMKTLLFLTLAFYYPRLSLMLKSNIFFGQQTHGRNDGQPPE